jgi:hypothetical protein
MHCRTWCSISSMRPSSFFGGCSRSYSSRSSCTTTRTRQPSALRCPPTCCPTSPRPRKGCKTSCLPRRGQRSQGPHHVQMLAAPPGAPLTSRRIGDVSAGRTVTSWSSRRIGLPPFAGGGAPVSSDVPFAVADAFESVPFAPFRAWQKGHVAVWRQPTAGLASVAAGHCGRCLPFVPWRKYATCHHERVAASKFFGGG